MVAVVQSASSLHGARWWVGVVTPVLVVLCTAFIGPGSNGELAVYVGSELRLVVLSISAIALLLRDRFVLPVLALTFVVDLAVLMTFRGGYGSHLAFLFAVHAFSARFGRIVVFPVVGALTLVQYLFAVFGVGAHPNSFFSLSFIAAAVLVTATGQLAYERSRQLRSTEERAEQAEATREAIAHERVTLDRLNTARDLHDVVSHHIAVVNIHSEIATASLADNPERAKQSLSTIGTASRDILVEIGALLRWLRETDSVSAHRYVGFRLGDPAAILEKFRGLGLDIVLQDDRSDHHRPGAAADMVLYALAEALTNAHKHGDTGRPVTIRMSRINRRVHLRVENFLLTSPTRTGTSSLGLAGLRERVEAVGGDVMAGIEGSIFMLDVIIPEAEDVQK